MDKWQAQQAFWSGFGLTAYNELTVPDNAQLPYITYEAIAGNIGAKTQASVSLWYRGNSWQDICQMSDHIAAVISADERPAIKIDNGYMMIRLPDGSMTATQMDEPSDADVRRIQFTVEIEFLTKY